MPCLDPVCKVGVAGGATAAAASGAAVSPRAKKLAASAGVDASQATGTGPNGRIIERDVQTLIANQPAAAPAAATVAAPVAAPAAAPAAPAVPEKDDSEIVAIVTSVICEELGADPSELCISGIREV